MSQFGEGQAGHLESVVKCLNIRKHERNTTVLYGLGFWSNIRDIVQKMK